MSLMGEEVKIIDSNDPTKTGRTGEIIFETSKTFELDTGGRRIMVEKAGSVFQVCGSKKVFNGNEMVGRLEDRLRLKRP